MGIRDRMHDFQNPDDDKQHTKSFSQDTFQVDTTYGVQAVDFILLRHVSGMEEDISQSSSDAPTCSLASITLADAPIARPSNNSLSTTGTTHPEVLLPSGNLVTTYVAFVLEIMHRSNAVTHNHGKHHTVGITSKASGRRPSSPWTRGRRKDPTVHKLPKQHSLS
ncbi:uncharacterized protein BO97DRAFT_480552 [Aspergillus homomorphus CBS 101889]|uniref:Uncharacterized protein n=1 Tax=Aspergillus homomorphus (strain CBS 101889) TaxID=1450537 RepID=A0A395HL01_ASPHC|nr:hypothetical protein BO97DRAFT_480552 [Aspergillus homomorphus CBS 101889]RAL08611.1 hypothetical protein BO97DRAFT_480552 [Aspergillus homomorphus CBS 101889]